MEKITADNPLSKSADLIKQNLETLKFLFPTIVKEGKIDLTELQALLGEEVENNEEYYRFTWAGKSQARQEANKPSTGTLRPLKKESKDWDTTENIFIEGDNLEVLKLMQKSYANKIKMVYIDPPYNTGKDFVYKDKYADNLGNYLSITGQTDEERKKLSTNTESDGRYHSNWLNMMYPRLKLARNLLKDDGVIFISIDDNEVANLKKVCDEIFGEENFIGQLAVQLNPRGRNLDQFIAKTHEHILIIAKNYSEETTMKGLNKEGRMVEEYNRNDNRGAYRLLGLRNRNQAFNPITRPKLYFPLFVNPITGEVSVKKDSTFNDEVLPDSPEGVKTCWTWNQDKVIKDNKLLIAEKSGDEWRVYRKDYLIGEDGLMATTLVKSIWFDKEISNDYGRQTIKDLFGKSIMDFPKSCSLLTKLIQTAVSHDDIILDFFAGSGTTAEAVMQLNSKHGGTRKFICVQLPEQTPPESEAKKAGFKTIADIAEERIRRAGEKVKSEMKEDLFSKEGKSLDIGFRVFKLDSSNINAWDGDVKNFQQNLLSASENIKTDRTEEDVLYEILLKSGLDLAQPIEEKTIAGKKVFNIGLGALFICLANDINKAVAEGIGKWKQELEPATCRVIFKDTGFTDVEKTNSIQILKRYGITEVNTI